MNKKSRIIVSVVVALLLIAGVIIIISTMLSGGAKSVSYSELYTYIENNRYYVAQDDSGLQVVKHQEGSSRSDDDPIAPEEYSIDENGNIVVLVEKTDKKGNVTQEYEQLVVIVKIQIDPYKINGYTLNSKGEQILSYHCGSATFYSTPESDSLVTVWINSFGLDVDYSNPNSGNIWSSVASFLGIILLCVVFWLIIRSTAGGTGKAMSFAKSKARVSTNIKVRFSDVAGAEEEKVELAEIVEFLKQPKKFADLGARIPKGVLLIGPPGTGKTLFAKAVAGEAGVPFFSVSGSDFVEMYVGVGASRVRDLFEMAKKNQPCIIFIDEIDAVGRHRGAGLGGGNDEREQTLNQILVQMDGFESNEGVIVIAATNRADILDPALTRPGRFDRQIYVNLPDVKGREQILKVHARNKPFAPEVNFKNVARLTVGFSGADLANLLNEAAILAARANKKFITNAELFESVDKITMGPAKKSKVVTEQEKRLTAFHESGHCILAKLCPNCDPVQEVTIIPRGAAGGYTLMRPDKDIAYYSKNYMIDDICMGLGGRVAEELVIKDISSGASGDIRQATKFARAMVSEFGMSEKLGPVCYSDDSQPVFLGRDMATQNHYSEETAKMIDDEVRDIINTQLERARKLLTENRSILDNMARVLIERETIYSDEVDMLMQGKDYKEVIGYMDTHDSASAGNPFKRYTNDEAGSADDNKDGE